MPEHPESAAGAVLAVFGEGGGWWRQVSRLVSHCEQARMLLLAPRMDRDSLPRYQQLGRSGARADAFVHECLRELSLLLPVDTTRFFLFGFSGGAQFAHRYAMAYPHRVHAAVVVAAGWYTFPDTARRFPQGIRSTRALPGLAFHPQEYLRVPIRVMVGSEDTADERVRRGEEIDAQQGPHRRARAANWVEAMRAQATAHGMAPLVEFTELPGGRHDFDQLCAEASLLERAFHVFEPRAADRPAATKGTGVFS